MLTAFINTSGNKHLQLTRKAIITLTNKRRMLTALTYEPVLLTGPVP